MSRIHSDEVALIRDNFEALCSDMGSRAVADLSRE